MYLLPEYSHIINPKLKHIYLSFDAYGNLIIKSPEVSQRHIENLILKKASWIEKSREKLRKQKGKVLNFSDQSELYFMGKAYPLILTVHSKKKSMLHFDRSSFMLHYYKYDEVLFQKQMNHFYKTEAQNYIPEVVNRWSKRMGLYPTDIRFRKTKRQWGSCTVKNVLNFNTMMMKLPQDVIQYIIVHELVHIKYKHHQKAFWDEVESYLPDYKLQVAELKTYIP